MDKNTLIGFGLMAAVLVGFSYFNQPSEAERHKMDSIAQANQLAQMKADSINEIQKAKALAAQEAKMNALKNDSAGILFQAYNGKEEKVSIENELVKFDLTTKGGVPCGATVKNYTGQDRVTPISLFSDEADKIGFAISGKNENVVTNDLFMQPVEKTDSSVIMRLALGAGHIDFAYKLQKNSYMMNLTIKAEGVANYFAPTTKSMAVSMHAKVKQLEKGYSFENRYSTLTYYEKEDGSDYLRQMGNDDEMPEESLNWIAFKNQFFNTTIIADQDFEAAKLTSVQLPENSGYLKEMDAQANTFFDPTGAQPTTMQFYFGPNHFNTLKASNKLSTGKKDLELEELVDLGWPLFRWINRFFTLYVFDWLSGFGMNMGIVLFIMTIILNAIVFPLRKKSYMSSAKMRVLKPKIEEINAKYPNKEDAMRKNQEVMQLYSQYGVSPMGGCLPMLIQMPVWIAMFNFVPNAIELRQQSFLWADDLSTYDDLLSWSGHVWGLGDHLSIFCLGFCATNIINSVISMRQQDNGANPQMGAMKWMMYLMPVMFFFIFNDYSSGLCWYYFVSGLMGVGVMWYLKKRTNDAELLQQLEKRRAEKKMEAGPGKVNMTGMAGRLQRLAERQQELQRQQQQKKNQ